MIPFYFLKTHIKIIYDVIYDVIMTKAHGTHLTLLRHKIDKGLISQNKSLYKVVIFLKSLINC